MILRVATGLAAVALLAVVAHPDAPNPNGRHATCPRGAAAGTGTVAAMIATTSSTAADALSVNHTPTPYDIAPRYCRGLEAHRWAMLQDMGYQRVAHLEGGFTAWKEAGRPTE